MREEQKELVRQLAASCEDLNDVQKLLKDLFKGTIEEMLESEMDEHLGYDKNSVAGNNSGNSRNGYNKKTIQSQFGESELKVPRDRNGNFEPRVLGKYQTKTSDIEKQIIAMYAKGMSTRDIEDHLRDIYGVEASASLISKITDKIMPQISEWQARPLDSVYPIVFLDGIVFKVRKETKIGNKCVYSVLGVTMEGKKEILGLWISDNEGAAFWTSVCNELKNRGLKDILIVCRDNLGGFSEAVSTVFPKAEQQLCIIHQIRNSVKHVSYKDLKPLMVDLKLIYKAVSIDEAEYQLEVFKEKWDKKYPQISKSWQDNWVELTAYFKYPEELRRIIYTTNAVEGFHRMLRKITKTKTSYPTDESLKKSIFLAISEISKKWNSPIRDWGTIVGQLMVFFDDRIDLQTAV